MTAYIRFADSLSAGFGKAFAWLIVLMTFGISYEVFVRYCSARRRPGRSTSRTSCTARCS